MENFLIDYRDPIFGLIILISTAFIIALFSYIWGIFSSSNESRKIEVFIKKFDSTNGLSQKYKEFLKSIKLENDTLGILANVFTKSGDFEKAINIYLIALENAKTKKEKEFIFTNLGSVYFKAGFLKKAEEIFLKNLEIAPRNKVSLKILSVIYEKLKMFDNELEILDALKEQDVEISKSLAFVKSQIIANDKNLSFIEKIEKIYKLESDYEMVNRIILELFIKHNEPLSNLKTFPKLNDCIDMIWYLEDAINLQDKEYKALFYAKNLINEYEESEFFEINAISAMRRGLFFDADLNFQYICDDCKSNLPSFFYRCPVCYSLKGAKILPKIVRKNSEINMPF
ncbi:tetratricopeptide repeat protein [Campylobacter sp. FMV-PI01]|uniref:Tetratricopeptide repeat protein n=1 Tax=Campylobacter portucalensis TaxID=2608384 RepID=A0A6L5WJM9_9BACT|nr:hypothetical protein [Campylobacter portucalensis]MSN96235.1 tetratricopeptide repeat protein [Campylobacter portucalensis]